VPEGVRLLLLTVRREGARQKASDKIVGMVSKHGPVTGRGSNHSIGAGQDANVVQLTA
jgi:hypothetical protein